MAFESFLTPSSVFGNSFLGVLTLGMCGQEKRGSHEEVLKHPVRRHVLTMRPAGYTCFSLLQPPESKSSVEESVAERTKDPIVHQPLLRGQKVHPRYGRLRRLESLLCVSQLCGGGTRGGVSVDRGANTFYYNPSSPPHGARVSLQERQLTVLPPSCCASGLKQFSWSV